MGFRVFILFLFNLSAFTMAGGSQKVAIRGSLVASGSYVTIRGEVIGEPEGITKSHRERIRWEGLTFNLWAGGVAYCKSGIYQVPLESLIKGTVEKNSNSFAPIVTILSASDLNCVEMGMPEWDKDFLIECEQLKMEINALKQHEFKLIENQRSEIHIRLGKLRDVYRIKKCNEKNRPIYGL